VVSVGQGRACDGCGVEMTWTPVLVRGPVLLLRPVQERG